MTDPTLREIAEQLWEEQPLPDVIQLLERAMRLAIEATRQVVQEWEHGFYKGPGTLVLETAVAARMAELLKAEAKK